MLARLKPEKFENAALFLRLGLPPTLIRTENGGFRKRSSKRKNLKTSAFRFSVDGKQFKNGAFCKRGRLVNPYGYTPGFLPPVIVAFSNFSGVVWTENI